MRINVRNVRIVRNGRHHVDPATVYARVGFGLRGGLRRPYIIRLEFSGSQSFRKSMFWSGNEHWKWRATRINNCIVSRTRAARVSHVSAVYKYAVLNPVAGFHANSDFDVCDKPSWCTLHERTAYSIVFICIYLEHGTTKMFVSFTSSYRDDASASTVHRKSKSRTRVNARYHFGTIYARNGGWCPAGGGGWYTPNADAAAGEGGFFFLVRKDDETAAAGDCRERGIIISIRYDNNIIKWKIRNNDRAPASTPICTGARDGDGVRRRRQRKRRR